MPGRYPERRKYRFYSATYRAARRASGKDNPRPLRAVDTDGHISNDWFRNSVWNKATAYANIGPRATPRIMRAAHASSLLAGGVDVQVVMERLGLGSLQTASFYLGTLRSANSAALNALDNIRSKRVADTRGAARVAVSDPEAEKDRKIEELQAKLAKFRELLDED